MNDPEIVFGFIALSGFLLMVGVWIGKSFWGSTYYRLGFRAGERAVADDFAARHKAPAIKISPRPFKNGIIRNN